ncbi:hypothetical protein J0H58_14110 [bacterium]|nr:hypothetical protein [bacterium]
MRIRTALVLALLAATATAGTGRQDGPKKDAAEVHIKGDNADETLARKAPPSGVIVSTKGWEALAKAWGITDAPKVDFEKTLLTVATTRGGRLNLTPQVKDGDLKVVAISTRDLRPGFRYEIVSVPRAGVKTVNGQPLPKE